MFSFIYRAGPMSAMILALIFSVGWQACAANTVAGTVAAEAPGKSNGSTADHSKFKQLQVDFKDGPQVTEACLECHTEAAKQLHQTAHWTWDYMNPQTGQRLGKHNVINNFCTSVPSNYKFCTACHIGYGWGDDKFDFTSERNVDCLVCHDTTGAYKKLPGLAGHPNYETIEWPAHSGKFRPPTDLKRIAQNVGKTSRKNCGACHFRGGGGDAVKHGDLDSSLEEPARYLDVHMDKDGLNFSCSECHATDAHAVSGSRYHPTAADEQGYLIRGSIEKRNPTTCIACHDNKPHKKGDKEFALLNQHTEKLACQTCHIPAYARGDNYTKMTWDWSTLGEVDEEGHPKKVWGSEGKLSYIGKKGSFTYDRYVIPEYAWFNGEVKFTLPEDKIDPNGVVKINEFLGGPNDGKSRIWPMKLFRDKQMYDKGNNTLVVTSLSDDADSALWKNLDVQKAVAYGQKYVGREFSGEAGFVATEMSWPITHMVAPKEDAVSCQQCHRENGRLAGIEGIYMPSTDTMPILDKLGWVLAMLTLIGVLGHSAIRLFMYKRGK